MLKIFVAILIWKSRHFRLSSLSEEADNLSVKSLAGLFYGFFTIFDRNEWHFTLIIFYKTMKDIHVVLPEYTPAIYRLRQPPTLIVSGERHLCLLSGSRPLRY